MMKQTKAYLALFLDAPLQSWGYQSKFDRRTSLSYPTRSGILGMICAAMGIDRADRSGLADLAELSMSTFSFCNHERLVDFHTVGGGWDNKTNPLNIVRKAGGGAGSTIVTRREYLQDAKFGVIIAGATEQLAEIAIALKNPKWGVWLGRKSCVPASPLCQGIFSSETEALAHLRQRAGADKEVRTVTEVAEFADGTDTLMDVPLDFANREFTPRRIRMV